jgi:hypothetical protein
VKAAQQVPARAGERGQHPLLTARLVLGSAYFAWSALAARQRYGPAAVRTVTGILGARHLAQALLTADRPARAVLALGVEVDAAHCASMILLGLLSGRWRTAAFTDALLAGAFAAAGTVCARSRPAREPGGPGAGPFGQWRDQCAEALARYLAPQWLSGTNSSSDTRADRQPSNGKE